MSVFNIISEAWASAAVIVAPKAKLVASFAPCHQQESYDIYDFVVKLPVFCNLSIDKGMASSESIGCIY